MKKYYLVKVRYDNSRFPFRNQVFQANSEDDAIRKYHESWTMRDGTPVDLDRIVSIEAEYLGLSENFFRFLEEVIGFTHRLLYVPFCLISFSLGLILTYDPQMFKSRERAKDPYRRWVYWVSYLGRPLYWVRCLLGTRDKIWTNMEKKDA